MRLLLDTHLLLWAAKDSERLNSKTRAMLTAPANQLFFSAASFWEIEIKRALGRADFNADPKRLREGLLGNGYSELPVTSEHALAIEALPAIHKDPFDRILIAQATVEGVTLLTADRQMAQYPGPIRTI